jgi:hypothetical protein
MSLRIRRGTDAQRQGVVFDLGEPIYTQDTKKLFVGDGITAGGTNILANSAGVGLIWNNATQSLDATGGGGGGGITAVSQDTNPALGGNLSLNGHNITGAGNISITGSISTSGTANFSGGLSGNFNLNSNNIVGTGNISVTGTISATGLVTANGGLVVANGLTVGTITGQLSGAVTLRSSNNSAVNIQSFTTDGSNINSVSLSIQVSRGSLASPTTVQVSDVLGGLQISGYNGTDYKPFGFVSAQVDASAVLTDLYPASVMVIGSCAGGSVINLAKLDAKGRWNAPRLQVTAYATGSYPASPIQGEIIFDSTTKHFIGYNGTAWVAFTGP